jgi:hypothetical protein
VALSFAGLLLASRPASRAEWLSAVLAATVGVALLLGPTVGLLDAVGRAWVVCVAAAFATCVKLRGGSRSSPAPFWPLALRACLYAAAALAVLGPVTAGAGVWREVQWEATRDASAVARNVIAVAPGLYPAFEPAVRLIAVGWPLWLVLEALIAMALARRAGALLARRSELI